MNTFLFSFAFFLFFSSEGTPKVNISESVECTKNQNLALQMPPVCFEDQNIWEPGRWDYRRNRRIWIPGRWLVQRVAVPCPPPPCAEPPRHQHDHDYRERGSYPVQNRCQWPSLDERGFAYAMSQIEAQSFESSKVSVARQMIAANCLTSFQVRDIMSNFGFESSRVEIAKAAWFRVVDPQQYYIVNDVFNFSSSSRELADFIEQNPR